MRKEEYIDLLNERLNILTSADFDSKVWTDQTIETLRRVFPISQDDKVKMIRRLNYHLGNIGTDQRARDEYLNKNKGRAKEYILGFIKEIEKHGIEKNSIHQSLHFTMIKNASFWTILLVIIGGAFYFGHYFGNNRFDGEKNNLFLETQKLNKLIEHQNQTIDSLKHEVFESQKLTGKTKHELDSVLKVKK